MKLKLLFVIIIILTISSNAMAQVGINTIEPTADLEIVADASPMTGKYNGIIIPKVDALPVSGDATFPTAAQAGLLVYLNPSATPDGTEGIYMFDGTQYVKLEPSSASGAFYDNGTTDFATTTTSNIEREGKVSIGSSLNTGKFNVDVVSANNSADPIALKVENNNTGTGSVNTYSAYLENKSAVGGSGIKYGIRSEVSSAGNSDRVGIYNNVISSGSAARGVIGINNVVGGTSGTTAINIGIRSEIGTPASDANSFGIYSIARGNDLRNNYSGWFQGDKFAIKNEDNSDGYELPVISGTSGQVLTTNGTDTATWSDLPAASSSPVFFNEGTEIAASNTTDNVWREGHLSLGTNSSNGLLTATIEADDSNGPRQAGYFTNDDENPASPLTYDTYGVRIDNDSETSGHKYGLRVNLNADGTGDRTGIYNSFTHQTGSSGTSTSIAFDNETRFARGTGDTYGIRNRVNNTSNNSGNVYALYSEVTDAGAGTGMRYAGLFNGTIGIGDPARTTGYDFPTDRGTAGQVLTTDGAGVASWQPVTFTEVDGSVTNEGSLSVTADTGTDDNAAVIASNTDSNTVTIVGASGISINEDATTRTITLKSSNNSLVRAHLSSQWQPTGSSPTSFIKIPFDVTSIDLESEFNPTTNQFVAKEPGYYRVSISVITNNYVGNSIIDSGGDNIFIGNSTHGLVLRKNSTVVASDFRKHLADSGSDNNIVRKIDDVVQLNTGDTLEAGFSDNNAQLSSDAARNYIIIEKIR